MSKGKTRCPKCGKHVSVRASACPACGAEMQPRVAHPTQRGPLDNLDKQALAKRAIVPGLLCTVVFGLLGFGLEGMSSGTLYSFARLLGLTSPALTPVFKALFGAALAVVVASFAILQQESEH